MSLFGDSSANLIFKIDADSDAAKRELTDLRNSMRQQLTQMRTDFGGWSSGLAASLKQAAGGWKGLLVAAGAAGAGMFALAKSAADYADEIESASDKTGISVEHVSALRHSAGTAGIDIGLLTNSLVLFTAAITDARRGVADKQEAFEALGITQSDLVSGTEDMLGLLYKVSDAFEDQANVVERTAAARRLFGDGGAEMVEWLSRGSESMREFMREAEQLGLVLTNDDSVAAKRFRLELQRMTAQVNALKLEIGKGLIPVMTGLMVLLQAAYRQSQEGWKAQVPILNAAIFFRHVADVYEESEARLKEALTETGTKSGFDAPEIAKAPKKIKDIAVEFERLSNMLPGVRSELASFGSEEEQIVFRSMEMMRSLKDAVTELAALREAGKVTAAVFEREMAAYGQLTGMIPEIARRQQERLFDAREQAAAEAAEVERQRLAEEEAARQQSFIQQLVDLQRYQAQMEWQRMTSAERIRFTYDEDLERFSDVEEAKALIVADSEGKIAAIRQQYDMMRQAALRRYGEELTILRNSSGWRGVFGDEFTSMIRHNEDLMREWATSTDQSMLAVRVTVASMGEWLARILRQLRDAFAQSVAAGLVYRQSIGAAMREAVAHIMESAAAEAYVMALMATARGMYALATGQFAAAARFFASAAIFTAAGTAAGLIGRAVAPRQEATGASAGGGSASGSSAGGSASESGAGGPRVAIYVSGSIIGQSGVEELTQLINEAVQDRDVRLVSTQVKQSTRATQ